MDGVVGLDDWVMYRRQEIFLEFLKSLKAGVLEGMNECSSTMQTGGRPLGTKKRPLSESIIKGAMRKVRVEKGWTVTQEKVAGSLGVSVPTLNRAIRNQGLSWKKLTAADR